MVTFWLVEAMSRVSSTPKCENGILVRLTGIFYYSAGIQSKGAHERPCSNYRASQLGLLLLR